MPPKIADSARFAGGPKHIQDTPKGGLKRARVLEQAGEVTHFLVASLQSCVHTLANAI
jgi:hypothetical protein